MAPKKPTTASTTQPPTYPPPETFTDGLPLPRVLIFDLDYTLWPFWVDTHVTPPLKQKDGGTQSVDRLGESFAFYPPVPPVLSAIKSTQTTHPLLLAAASRTHTPDLALTLLKQLTISPESGPSSSSSSSSSNSGRRKAIDLFDSLQIYPGDKTQHMQKIRKQLGVEFGEMLFFDDEVRNRNVEGLGVGFWLVTQGVTGGEVDRGVREWRRRRGLGRG